MTDLISRVRRASQELAPQIEYLRATNVSVPADMLRQHLLFEAVLAILLAVKGSDKKV